jgi:hypothetical protein
MASDVAAGDEKLHQFVARAGAQVLRGGGQERGWNRRGRSAEPNLSGRKEGLVPDIQAREIVHRRRTGGLEEGIWAPVGVARRWPC